MLAIPRGEYAFALRTFARSFLYHLPEEIVSVARRDYLAFKSHTIQYLRYASVFSKERIGDIRKSHDCFSESIILFLPPRSSIALKGTVHEFLKTSQ